MKDQILKDHGITTKIEGLCLFALEVCFNTNTNTIDQNWINVTDWTIKDIYFWLGY